MAWHPVPEREGDPRPLLPVLPGQRRRQVATDASSPIGFRLENGFPSRGGVADLVRPQGVREEELRGYQVAQPLAPLPRA